MPAAIVEAASRLGPETVCHLAVRPKEQTFVS